VKSSTRIFEGHYFVDAEFLQCFQNKGYLTGRIGTDPGSDRLPSMREVGVSVSFFARNTGPHCIGVALAAAVLLGYFPSRATAECGEYVVILNNKSASKQQEDLKSHIPTETSSDRGRPHLPCRGPNCSSGPSRHGAPLSAPVPTRNESKVSITQLTPENAGAEKKEWRHVPTCKELPVHIPDPVFHPPRVN
jgi:hypothetical protein